MKTADRIRSAVNCADSLTELKRAHKEIDDYIKEAYPKLKLDQVRNFFKELNSLHFRMKEKALQLAAYELNLMENDFFCWGMMGSGAREEQTVRTDQDNCLFYRAEAENENDMAEFADIGVRNLADAGYPLCSGNVMATNSRWRFAENSWNEPDNIPLKFEDVRYAFILLDVIPIYGNGRLLNEAKDNVITALCSDPQLLVRMWETASSLRVPYSPLGKIFTERYGKHAGKLSIKTSAYAPLVLAVKFLSLTARVKDVSTFGRLESLEQQGVISVSMAQEVASALDVFLYLRLGNSAITPFHETPDDYIHLEKLSKEDLQHLKKGLRTVKKLQKFVRKRGCECEAQWQ